MKSSEGEAVSARELKILALFIHRYRWGEQIRGDERGFLEKMRAYRDLGVRVYTLELGPPLQNLIGEQVYAPLCIKLNIRWGDNALDRLTRLFKLTFATICLSRKVRFDIVYAYNQDSENVVPAFFIKLLSRKNMVLIFHLFYQDYASSFRRAFSKRLSRGFGLIGAFLRSLLDSLSKCAFRSADLIICVSGSVRKDVLRHIKTNGVIVVPNGVNHNSFRKYDLPKIYDAVFLGRLCHQKGIDVLLKAWKRVSLKLGDARLVLIGGGDEEHVMHYAEMIRELSLEGRVDMKGFVQDEELVTLLNSSKLFLFPSRYDGFTLAVTEAMACGLPCVVSDIPALRETYGSTAILVKPDDSERLAEVIEELLRDEKKREALSKSSIEFTRGFDWKKTVSKEISFMETLLQGRV
ncbi:MAG: glycosyltransferase family 4 protein [Thermoproteota archaeon]